MVRISDSGPGWKSGFTPFDVQTFRKSNSSSTLYDHNKRHIASLVSPFPAPIGILGWKTKSSPHYKKFTALIWNDL